MRFSYIDSEGKEIEVDSVESLALRIELGAIQPDTRMYDAVADRWAPAREHPVFRSLSRGEEVLEEDVVPIGEEGEPGAEEGEEGEPAAPGGEVPEPPEPEVEPPTPPGPEIEPGASEPAGPSELEIEPGPAEPEPAEPPEPEVQPGAPETEPPEPETDRADPGPPAPEHARPVAEDSGAPPDDGGDAADDVLGLDFEVTMQEDAVQSSDAAAGPPADARDDEDRQDHGVGAAGEGEAGPDDADEDEAGEDDELPLIAPAPERPLAPEPFVSGDDAVASADPGGASDDAEETAGDDRAGSGEESAETGDRAAPPEWASEEEALFSGEPPAPDPTGSVDGGADLGDAADDELPQWAREGGDRSVEGEGRGGTDTRAPAREDRAERDRPPPGKPQRSRPSRPPHWERRERARARRGRLVRVVSVLLVLGAVGGGVAYVLGPGSSGGEETSAGTSLPSLPPALHDVMVEVNGAAYGDLRGELRGLFERRGLPDGPPDGGLNGVYLSTAGQYPGVREYWSAVRDAVEGARRSESEIFRERLDRRLEARTGGDGLSRAEADRVRDAALGRYEAAAPARRTAYEHLLDVAQASLDLHLLLVEREADIAYEPYSSPGVSRDPVLEAVPADSGLRAEMNQRVDRVLDLMDDAEIPRPITTAGLVDHLLGELRSVEPDAS